LARGIKYPSLTSRNLRVGQVKKLGNGKKRWRTILLSRRTQEGVLAKSPKWLRRLPFIRAMASELIGIGSAGITKQRPGVK